MLTTDFRCIFVTFCAQTYVFKSHRICLCDCCNPLVREVNRTTYACHIQVQYQRHLFASNRSR